jgi:multiple sugar transport system ATP-binding protein
VRGLVKAFGDSVILDGIDLEIRAGEFFVLVGPSGCGKSTLLRCIAGLEEITAGDLLIDGRRANDLAPKDRDLAMVFQSYALYPHMTVAENLGFSLAVRRMKPGEIRARVEEVAARLELSALLERMPRQLSGGQRQRVAVGRAIVRRPVAFLFDEPLSNLDAALRGQLRVELRRLHRELGATMVYVTHDQVEALTLADRICVLDRGRVQQVGTPVALFERPANRFVAGFIGSPAMNFLPGAVEEGRAAISGPGFELPLAGALSGPATAREVHVGLRPSAFALQLGAEGEGVLSGTLDLVENVGFDSYAHLRLPSGQAVVAQLPTRSVAGLAAGTALALYVAPGEVHLFDPATGAAIEVTPATTEPAR